MIAKRIVLLLLAAGALGLPGDGAQAAPRPERLTLESVNAAAIGDPAKPSRALLVRVAVLLDRARVSPGVIDGRPGQNLDKAVRAYRTANGLSDDPTIDAALLAKLTEGDVVPALVAYTVTPEDAKGPWTRRIPAKMEQHAKLTRLGYRDAGELLAERFHMGADLLRELNRNARLGKAGAAITVASVSPEADPSHAAAIASGRGVDRDSAAGQKGAVARIVIDKAAGTLQAFDAAGRRLLFDPVSVGSPEKPAPSGTLHVARVAPNPNYTYDPAYAFKGVKAKTAFEIAPGPNNPVGSVWIALDREGYGIHGTPEPSTVGKAQSHGCIRLTNWSALQLAAMVDKGVPVEFGE